MTAAVGQEIGVMGTSWLNEDDQATLRRMSSSKREQKQLPIAGEEPSVKTMASPSVYGRTVSSSLLEAASVAISLLGQDHRRGGRGGAGTGAGEARILKSASVVWKEPMLLVQRMSSTKKTTARRSTEPSTTPKKAKKQQMVHELQKTSRWIRFWKRLRLDGGGKKKVHGEWLNYDAQSYAMNFEKDRESPVNLPDSRPLLPRIDGPGAREIVTVLLRRSPATNKNPGFVLIPKPVLVVGKQGTSPPLWQRRSVREPVSLDVKCVTTNSKVRK